MQRWAISEIVKKICMMPLTPPPQGGVQSIVMSMSVCLSVCLFVTLLASLQITHGCTSANFVHVSYSPTQSYSGGVVIRYVLPVLWMTSYCRIMAQWHAMCIFKRRWNMTSITAMFPTIFFFQRETNINTHLELHTRGKVCYLQISCIVWILKIIIA